MKKLLLIAILMLALVFTVAACKTEPTTNETTAGETTAAPAPVETTAEPADETTAAAPEETTVAPVETTEAPVETTEAPVETTEEPEETTADPADPVWIIDAEGLSAMSGANNATGELKEGYVSLTATGGDPYFYPVAPNGNIGAMPEYLVISYRTNTTMRIIRIDVTTGEETYIEPYKDFQ